MPTFLHPALLAGLALVAVPVLIHLINMFRHRRVTWAAMEFLLESQRRSRRWIILRQLLLLLMRMAAVAAVVLIVARPRLPNRLGAALGTGSVHHVVLLDDSFSMSDREGETSAMERGKQALRRIVTTAAEGPAPASVTLLRFSHAAREAAAPDWLEERIDATMLSQFEQTLGRIQATNLDVGPDEAVASLDELLGPAEDEQRVIYIVSDFRRRQWSEAEQLPAALRNAAAGNAQLHLVACVDRQHENLAIAALRALPSVQAAGVPMQLEVSVNNFGAEPARNVVVALEENGRPRPSVMMDEIEPGQQATRRFNVNFPNAGQHVITARLQGDAVSVDNTRFAVMDVSATVPTLLVDGGAATIDARFLTTALAPGGLGRTGVSPRIELPEFLERRSLDPFRTIFILNVDQLSRSAVEALESFVSGGGGVAFFLGPETDSARFNEQLYRDGQGIFPLPLSASTALFASHTRQTPDLEVTPHPVFRVFEGQRNDFLKAVTINRYFAVAPHWQPPTGSQVIARLRNEAPLVVEKQHGDGRVVAFLTTAAPTWNNWSRNPSFVVAMLELNAYLASAGRAAPRHHVGDPLELQLAAALYEPQVRIAYQNGSERETIDVDAVAAADSLLKARLTNTPKPGVYTAQLLRTDGQSETRRYALNVSAEEGDLAMLSASELASELENVPYEYHRADDPQISDRDLAGFDLSRALVVLLLLALVAEQGLAFSASYHPPAEGAIRR